jgi:hypothetical protein
MHNAFVVFGFVNFSLNARETSKTCKISKRQNRARNSIPPSFPLTYLCFGVFLASTNLRCLLA